MALPNNPQEQQKNPDSQVNAQKANIVTARRIEPEVGARQRVDTVSTKVTSLKKSLDTPRASVIGDVFDKALKLVTDSTVDLVKKRENIKKALTSVLNELKRDPRALETPTPEMLDTIKKIGKAGEENAPGDPQVDELRQLYKDLKQKMDATPSQPPTIIINNNNIAPQAVPLTPTPMPEPLMDPADWDNYGKDMIYQIKSLNDRVKVAKSRIDAKRENKSLTPEEERDFEQYAARERATRKLMLTTLNATIENLRNPQTDTKIRPLSTPETVAAMNRWLLAANLTANTVNGKKALFNVY